MQNYILTLEMLFYYLSSVLCLLVSLRTEFPPPPPSWNKNVLDIWIMAAQLRDMEYFRRLDTLERQVLRGLWSFKEIEFIFCHFKHCETYIIYKMLYLSTNRSS